MKILMMTNTYTPIVGGVEASIQSLTRQLKEKGHEVVIVAPCFEAMPEQEEGVVRIPAIQKFNHTDFSVNLPIPGLLEKLMFDFKPDIVHSHHPFLIGDMALRLSGQYGIPLIFTYHTMYEEYIHYLPFQNNMIRRFVIELSAGYANLADQVIVPTRSVRDILHARGVDTPIDIIPTGIDVKKFSQGKGTAMRQSFNIPREAFVIGHVGRLAPEKNLEFLAHAVTEFLKEDQNAHFLLVGKGPCEKVVQEIFHAKGMDARIHCSGVLRDAALANAYHVMDIFAFTSQTETQGLVLAEALAAGIPVVALDAPGVRDIVKDTINGRIIHGQERDTFVSTLMECRQKSSTDFQEMKKNAQKSIQHFSCEETARNIFKVYGQAKLQKKKRREIDNSLWQMTMQRIKTEWSMVKNLADASEAAYSETAFDIKTPRHAPQNNWMLRLRRWLNTHEWSARILKLSQSTGTESKPGLIMIQIDGFSKTQFENALKNKEMPFCQGLLHKQRYKIYPFFTGMPSTTPSVQGELFYGVKQIVPAFSYFDQRAQKVFTMFDGDDATEIERRLKERGGPGLLEGGSSYSNVYAGGAKEAHFCAISLGLDKIWKDVNPLSIILLALTHFVTLIRIILLVSLEMVLATMDFIFGLIDGENFRKEFKFVSTRGLICILLRELITLGSKIDIARGLPIIHLNFLGYDEQAHRRGPSSKFAHWALKGIDLSIADIYKNALQSTRRNYDVWIYSDHGQEDTSSYMIEHGMYVFEAIEKLYRQMYGISSEKGSVHTDFRGHNGLAGKRRAQTTTHDVRLNCARHSPAKPFNVPPKIGRHQGGCSSFREWQEPPQRGIQFSRARYLGKRFIQNVFTSEKVLDHDDIKVTAIGPTGNIYLTKELNEDENFLFARKLVRTLKIPLVFLREGPGKVRAFNKHGEFILPDQAKEVLGEDHPYLKEVTQDLIAVCHHASAGTFTFSGWRPHKKPVSFPIENGAHAGPGIRETNAFALMPSDIVALPSTRAYLRTMDLREYALQFLGRTAPEKIDAEVYISKKTNTTKKIRIMTYNVHNCQGMDGKTSPERIARVIARHEPDIVALQELDVKRHRTGGIDQPHLIAKHLKMIYHFHPNICIEEGLYGNAILSRYPMKLIYASRLPILPGRPDLEFRGAIWATVDVEGTRVQIFNTHLGLRPKEQLRQAEALVGEDWLTHSACDGPVILCGDFNALPGSSVVRRITETLRDAQVELDNHRPHPTWFSPYPLGRIDHIFINPQIEVTRAHVSKTALDKTASDHLPLVVDVMVKN